MATSAKRTVKLGPARALVMRPQLSLHEKEYADVGGFSFSADAKHLFFSVSLTAGSHKIMRLSMEKLSAAADNPVKDPAPHTFEKEIVGETFAYGRDITCLSDGRLALIEAGRQNTGDPEPCLCGCNSLLSNKSVIFIAIFIFGAIGRRSRVDTLIEN